MPATTHAPDTRSADELRELLGISRTTLWRKMKQYGL